MALASHFMLHVLNVYVWGEVLRGEKGDLLLKKISCDSLQREQSYNGLVCLTLAILLRGIDQGTFDIYLPSTQEWHILFYFVFSAFFFFKSLPMQEYTHSV